MATKDHDRNLLFGILAVQMDFISREALIGAMNSWVLAKDKPLGAILVEQKAMSQVNHDLLAPLVEAHIRQHANDPQQSLAAVSSLGSVRDDLSRIADPDIQASIVHLPERSHDPDATRAPSVGSSTSSGTRFRIVRPHAEGGLGKVSVARDEELRREVALKEIKERHADNPDSRARFLQEAEITGGLEHPSIVPVYGLGQYADGRPYYAMRFIRGDSLKEAVDRYHDPNAKKASVGERAVELRKLLGRFLDVCNAIAYAHSRGVLHRDLKPGNIMLGQYGETLVVDWGLAKSVDRPELKSESAEGLLKPSSGSGAAATEMGSALGTPQYMSPEQAAGRLDLLGPASDVYGLGATLYYVLTGKPPIEADDIGTVLKKVQNGELRTPRAVNPEIAPPLEAICLKAMALSPGDRYPSPSDLAEDIEHWLADEPVTAHRDSLLARLSRTARRHKVATATVAALLFAGIVGLTIGTVLLGREQARTIASQRERVLAQVGALRKAEISQVPYLIDDLKPFRAEILPQLRQSLRQAELGEKERLRLSLAVVADDKGEVAYLSDRLLNAEPGELLVIRNALAPYKDSFVEKLWGVLESPKQGNESRRLRAAAALAAYDPTSTRWAKISNAVPEDIVAQNPIFLNTWSEAFSRRKEQLVAPLAVIFRDQRPERTGERNAATGLLAEYAADNPQALADLLMDADEKQFGPIFGKLKEHGPRAIAPLETEIDKELYKETNEDGKEALAQRQANAAVALIRLGHSDKAWPLLHYAPDPSASDPKTCDPRVRSWLIHRLQPLGADVMAVVAALRKQWQTEVARDEQDVSRQRALILALGEFDSALLAASEKQSIADKLLDIYRTHPDPGLHAAAEWLLKRKEKGWDYADKIAKIDDKLQETEKQLHSRNESDKRHWYVNKHGQTLVILTANKPFQMGSPATESERNSAEGPHQQKIGRTFAIATKTITRAQFRVFLEQKQNADRKALYDGGLKEYIDKYSPKEDGPQVDVNWYDAARFCNWLSAEEGLDKDEFCYQPIENGKYAEGMKPATNYLQRRGYRLPTEAEWEYACRAGAETSRYFGASLKLLPRYSWFVDNSKLQAWPVGQNKPNDMGLFDMHGNVWQWCDNVYRFDKPNVLASFSKAKEDAGDDALLGDKVSRVLRGGSFGLQASYVRSAYRDDDVPSVRSLAFGFRVARTYNLSPLPPPP